VLTDSLKLYARAITVILVAAAATLILAPASAQQSIVENIRPVGQVCLAGGSCTGASTAPASATTATPAPAAFDVAVAYQQNCFACHGTGAAGAHVLGDAEAWSMRVEKGREAMMANVMNGLNAMPARGLCVSCSDDDLNALVDYLISQ
jgi:cytochrome c5